MELRAEKEFPISVSDLRLASCSYRLPDGKQRATLAALPAKKMAAVEKMLEVAGCKVMSISLGLDDCVGCAEEPTQLHFVANGNHVDVVIAAGGGIASATSSSWPARTGTIVTCKSEGCCCWNGCLKCSEATAQSPRCCTATYGVATPQ